MQHACSQLFLDHLPGLSQVDSYRSVSCSRRRHLRRSPAASHGRRVVTGSDLCHEAITAPFTLLMCCSHNIVWTTLRRGRRRSSGRSRLCGFPTPNWTRGTRCWCERGLHATCGVQPIQACGEGSDGLSRAGSQAQQLDTAFARRNPQNALLAMVIRIQSTSLPASLPLRPATTPAQRSNLRTLSTHGVQP